MEDSEILDDFGNCYVLFLHSSHVMPSNDNKEWVSSTCNNGDNSIASVRRGNVHVVQFHLEKSEKRSSKPMKGIVACLDVRTVDARSNEVGSFLRCVSQSFCPTMGN